MIYIRGNEKNLSTSIYLDYTLLFLNFFPLSLSFFFFPISLRQTLWNITKIDQK